MVAGLPPGLLEGAIRVTMKLSPLRLLFSGVLVQALWLSAASPVEELRTSAAGGDAAAQAELGLAYMLGRGVASNSVEAVKWLRRAA